MGFQLTTVLVCALAAAVVLAQDENQTVAVRGNNKFGNAWLKLQQKQSTTGNLNLCPFSAVSVLAMLMMGAAGTTLTEMAKGLYLPQEKDIVASGFRSLIQSLEEAGSGNNTFNVANRIYLDSSFVIKTNFKKTLQIDFSANAILANFTESPDSSRLTINHWVEEKTNNKIKELLPQGTVTSSTRSVLVNAVYFKGKWLHQFSKSNTRSQKFYQSCNKLIDVDMMTQTNDFMYGDFGDYEVAELFYQDKRLCLMILLPKSCSGSTLLDRTDLNITELHRHMRTRKLRLTIPKFKAEQTIKMDGDLEKLGLGQMYSNSANFSYMTMEGVKVSTVIQKTYIEVSEEGTEAAAATGVVIVPLSATFPIPFTANRPFVFLIADKSTEAIIFMGEYRGQ